LTLDILRECCIDSVSSEYTKEELSNEDVKSLLIEIYLIYSVVLTRYIEQKTYFECKQKILRKNHTNGISLPYLQEILKHVDWVGYLSLNRFKTTPLYESLSKSRFFHFPTYKFSLIRDLIYDLDYKAACTENILLELKKNDPLEWFFDTHDSDMITLTPKIVCLLYIIRILTSFK